MPPTYRNRLAASLAAALLASASPVSAAGPADQAAAVELFQEARRLVAAGDFEHACPKFAEAQRLLPTAGTLLSLGDCYERAGKLASSWGAFKEAEFFARNTGATEHQAEAQRRAEAIAPKLARLAIVVPPAAKAPGLEVRRDGNLVGEAQWGSPVPTDTGYHKIEATAPGRKAWSSEVRVEVDGSSASVYVPVLDVAGPSAGLPGADAAPFWTGQRIAGTTIAGAGLVGMIVGAAFAGKAAGKNNDSLPHCQPNDVTKCDAAGVALRDDAFSAAHVSTGMFVAGGVLAAGGLVVFLTAPRKAVARADAKVGSIELRPVAGPSIAGLTFKGAW